MLLTGHCFGRLHRDLTHGTRFWGFGDAGLHPWGIAPQRGIYNYGKFLKRPRGTFAAVRILPGNGTRETYCVVMNEGRDE